MKRFRKRPKYRTQVLSLLIAAAVGVILAVFYPLGLILLLLGIAITLLGIYILWC